MTQDNNATHWVLGGALLLIGLFVIIALVLTRAQTETATTTLTVTATAPSVDTIKLCSGTSASPTACSHVSTATGVTLSAASTAGYQIAGTISDANGFSDITTFKGSFYNTSIGSASCDTETEQTNDDANCYYAENGAGCTLTSTSSTAGYFDCDLAIQYYATATSSDAVAGEQGDPTDTWTVQGYVEDTGASSDTATDTTEVNTLRAIGTSTGNACASIAYGEIANGSATTASSAAGTDCVLTNDGNVDTDITEQAGHMSCTFGGIATTNQRVNTTSGTYAAMATGGTDLSSSAQTIDLVLDKSNGSVSQDSLFHAISVPSTGASGTCSGVNTIVAVSEV